MVRTAVTPMAVWIGPRKRSCSVRERRTTTVGAVPAAADAGRPAAPSNGRVMIA